MYKMTQTGDDKKRWTDHGHTFGQVSTEDCVAMRAQGRIRGEKDTTLRKHQEVQSIYLYQLLFNLRTKTLCS